MTDTPRIALVHATPLAIAPIGAAFATFWPAAVTQNILDDALSADLNRDGELTPAMMERFQVFGRYAVDGGADGILFTCSAFGRAIEAVAATHADRPVLKPNEAMFEEAIAHGGTIGMVATFGPSVPSMQTEFDVMAKGAASLQTVLAEGAMEALASGDGETHDRLIAEAAARLDGCPVILLAQFSMARAADTVAALTGKPVLTSPKSAVEKLKAVLGA